MSRECKCPVISEFQPLTLNENSAFDNLRYVAGFLKVLFGLIFAIKVIFDLISSLITPNHTCPRCSLSVGMSEELA